VQKDKRSQRLVRLSILLSLLMLMTACEINRLSSATEHYDSGRYAAAILEADKLVEVGQNGAIITRAEMIRSSSYLELGKTAEARDNRSLAIRFYKLANSDEADLALAELYYRLGEDAMKEGNLPLAKLYMDDIIREIPRSPLAPQVLLRRININMEEYRDRDAVWEDYKTLYDSYPNNVYEIQARYYVRQFIDSKIDYAEMLLQEGYFEDSLRELFELSLYPVVDSQEINRMISDVYQAQADELFEDGKYQEADSLYRIAVQYNPAKQAVVDAKLVGITDLYVREGDRLLEARDFEAALNQYRTAFEIIPDYPPARDAIARLNRLQDDIMEAARVAGEASRMESSQLFAEALRLYNQAYTLDPQAEFREKAQNMQNLIEAQDDPTGVARRIINQYRGGLLLRRIEAKRAQILEDHDQSDVRDSGWRILLSTGQYKYEARYDILTPTETFLYVWQINLRDRSIIPLNRLSEALMQ